MIQGLAKHLSENDIRRDIIQCGLKPLDIRLIRMKETGTSRGFAFVEFFTLDEAIRWMNIKQGVLMLQEKYHAIMQYSIPKDVCGCSEKSSGDWFCIKCGAQNFKRRDRCFKCNASMMESEKGGSGSDEVCNYITKTIMVRNLDILTNEDTVMTVLNLVIPELVKSILTICIGRDPLTSTSRGICYIGFESTIDALAVHRALINLSSPLTIDSKRVILSYCKLNLGDNMNPYSQVDSTAVPSNFASSDVESLAECAARRYAKTTNEYMQYVEYYKNFFTQQIINGNLLTSHQENQMDSANTAAAVAQLGILQMHANKNFSDTTYMSIPNGTDGKRYPVPDISKYTKDVSTGYQYDATTGLYYDSNSSYYWNYVIQKYMYWDQEKLTYILVPTSYYDSHQIASVTTSSTQKFETKKHQSEKEDKVEVAKKVSKDMETWVKAINQNRDLSLTRSSTRKNSSAATSTSTSLSVLGRMNATHLSVSGYHKNKVKKKTDVEAVTMTAAPLVAAYNNSSNWCAKKKLRDDGKFLNYKNLTCNLRNPQLRSDEALTKHKKISDLHNQSPKVRKRMKKLANSKKKVLYRDRAKERRMQYGDSNEPRPNKLKEKYLKSREFSEVGVATAFASEPIGAENVGHRLLQKMGWTKGQGLGKQNQGITTIIQTEQYSSTLGLGNNVAGYTTYAGESYSDCGRKRMYARYQELTKKEN